MRISDWSSDVCSSDLRNADVGDGAAGHIVEDDGQGTALRQMREMPVDPLLIGLVVIGRDDQRRIRPGRLRSEHMLQRDSGVVRSATRSEEHTSELQPLIRISFDVLGWKKKHRKATQTRSIQQKSD